MSSSQTPTTVSPLRLKGLFWFAVAVALLWGVFILTVNNKTDWDLWGGMSVGALMEANGWQLVKTEPFSYTAYGAPWAHHEWGSGLLFYTLLTRLGSPALYGLKLLLFLAIMGIPAWQAYRQWFSASAAPSPTPPAPASVVVYGTLFLLSTYCIIPVAAITIRCQLFTFLLFGVFLLVLERHRTQQRWPILLLLPVLMVPWVNLHGGYIVGLVQIGCYAVGGLFSQNGRAVKELTVAGLACLLAALFNPYGWALNVHLAYAWSIARTDILEWMDVWAMHTPMFGAVYCTVVAVTLGLWGARAFGGSWSPWSPGQHQNMQPVVWAHGILLAAFAWQGYAHNKLSPLFLIAALILLPTLLQAVFSQHGPTQPSLNRLLNLLGWGTPTGLLLLLIGSSALFLQKNPTPWVTQVQGIDTYNPKQQATQFMYPIGAVSFLRKNQVQGNLWCPFVWGEYLYWSLTPKLKVSIDGRYEAVYPLQVFEDTYQFYQPPFPTNNARKYPTDYVMVAAHNKPLLKAMAKDAYWQLIYQDSVALLYERANKKALSQKVFYQQFSNQSVPLDSQIFNLSRFRIERAHTPR